MHNKSYFRYPQKTGAEGGSNYKKSRFKSEFRVLLDFFKKFQEFWVFFVKMLGRSGKGRIPGRKSRNPRKPFPTSFNRFPKKV